MNSPNAAPLTVGSLEVVVIRKRIRNLHLTLLPPHGQVRVSAPMTMREETIREFVTSRMAWIQKHQEKMKAREWEAPLDYVSGEMHSLWGARYRLEVVESKRARAIFAEDKIVLSVRANSNRAKRKRILMEAYRREMRAVAGELHELWQQKMGLRVNSWGLKQMKTRWGTCNTRAARIWLNLELAKKPQRLLHYIIAHELTHLVEKKHNARFKAHLDAYLPDWRKDKEELNRSVLS